MVVRSVRPLSLAKILCVLYAALGLFMGLIFAVIGMFGGLAARGGSEAAPWISLVFGAGAVVALPILYGILGLVGGVVTAVLYNVIAGFTGGIELDVQ